MNPTLPGDLSGLAAPLNPPAASDQVLHVSVTHGDLRDARFPVLVGHYEGDSIVNAERLLDRQLGGRLQRRVNLGLYPGAEDTAEVFLDELAAPIGAIVVGLGEVGGISAGKIRRAVRRGVLEYALKLLAPDYDGTARATIHAGVSAVLIGTNGARELPLFEAIGAIVQGVLDAGTQLLALDLDQSVSIEHLEFIEIYEDVATHAHQALAQLETSSARPLAPGIRLAVGRDLQIGAVRRATRPYDHSETGWWRRLQIGRSEGYEPGRSGLKFEVLTDRARAEGYLALDQSPLIDDLLRQARLSPLYNEKIAATLFELLVPRTLKPRLSGEASIQLVLDVEAAAYPWEMLAQRAADEIIPLADRMGLLRQLKIESAPAPPRSPRGYHALVIGNPDAPAYRALEEAELEAEEVFALLTRHQFASEAGPLVGANAEQIVTELFAQDYRIIHIAAHGEIKTLAADPAHQLPARIESGVVIGDRRALTAAEIGALPFTPDIVFLNCCHLGRMSAEPAGGSTGATSLPPGRAGEFAASIAWRLIAAGIKVVVIAAWAVDDTAARTFATTFYGKLLAGNALGDAVLAARQATREQHPTTNTWAAYQVYGSPNFRLEVPVQDTSASPFTQYSTRSECLADLSTLAAEARWVRPEAAGEMAALLRTREAWISEAWRDSEVLEALGTAWARYGYYREAIAAFEQAVARGAADLRVTLADELALVKIQRIEQVHALGDPEREIAGLGVSLREHLDLLVKFGHSPESLCLVGAIYQRLAQIAASARERRRALGSAEQGYRQAYHLSHRQKGRPDPHSGLSWLLCRFLLKRELESFAADFALLETEIASRIGTQPSFRDALSGGAALVLKHLVAGDFPARRAEIKNRYDPALQSASLKERGAAAHHLRFIARMLAGRAQQTNRRELLALADDLERRPA